MGSAQTRQGPSPWTLIIWGSSSIRCCPFGRRADIEDAAFRRPIFTHCGHSADSCRLPAMAIATIGPFGRCWWMVVRLLSGNARTKADTRECWRCRLLRAQFPPLGFNAETFESRLLPFQEPRPQPSRKTRTVYGDMAEAKVSPQSSVA